MKMFSREVNLGDVTPLRLSLSSVTSYALIDLFRSRLMVSSKVSQVVFVHVLYKFSVIFGTLLFILVICRSQMEL